MALTDGAILRRSLTSRMFSTVTTIATVGVAVGLMIVLLAMKDAGRKAFDRGSGTMHLLISRDASPLTAVLNGIFYANAPAAPIQWNEYQQIRAAFPWAWAIPTQQGDSYRGLPVMATSEEFFTKFQPAQDESWEFAEGEVFDEAFEIVLGAEAARMSGLRIGSVINLTHGMPRDPSAHVHEEYDYTVVGILEPTGSAHDRAVFSDLRSTWIIHAHDRRVDELGTGIGLTTVADLTDADRLITGIYGRVATRPGSDASSAIQQVFFRIRSNPTFTVASPSDQISKLFQIVGNIDRIFLAMAGVVVISSGIGIMLALYNSMEQRRRQIAVLRVLGCPRNKIFGLVLTESAILGMLGAVAGVLLAFVGGQVASAAMQARLGLVIDPGLPPLTTLNVVLGTVILASLAGVIPALKAYRTPVAENLRPLG